MCSACFSEVAAISQTSVTKFVVSRIFHNACDFRKNNDILSIYYTKRMALTGLTLTGPTSRQTCWHPSFKGWGEKESLRVNEIK
jgi:hypothetical protein